MKALNKFAILFLVFMSIVLTSCTLGGTIFKEQDGFGYNTMQQNTVAIINTDLTMN
ncbi:MAG: hypothetical protein JXQ69_02620 [Paludibacteraceae bacterium]|nr:hypothetical protein [Paludibacteraceae bacterium]MBN2787195.1 hypothetical protein [Paludibacteraceae bacterium]